MTPLTISFRVTPADIGAFNRFFVSGTRQGQTSRLLFAFLVAAGGAALTGLRPGGVAVAFAAALLLYVAYPRTAASHAEHRARLAAAKPHGDGVVCEHTLTLTPEGILESTPLSQTRTAWSLVRSVAETPTHAFVFISESMAHVIPRSAVPPEAFSAFVSTARSLSANRGT